MKKFDRNNLPKVGDDTKFGMIIRIDFELNEFEVFSGKVYHLSEILD